MSGHPFVVLADRVAGFETLTEAKEYALANPPCVICQRRQKPDGTSILIEVLRHDFLYDSDRREWRVMMGWFISRALEARRRWRRGSRRPDAAVALAPAAWCGGAMPPSSQRGSVLV